MSRYFLMHPSSGTGVSVSRFYKSIRFALYGCANRPFYHIVVMDPKLDPWKAPIEQLGSFDPIPNERNEKLVAFNFERLQYWISQGAQVSRPVAELLGLAGFFPVHPRTYMKAWRNRQIAEKNKTEEIEPEKQAISAS